MACSVDQFMNIHVYLIVSVAKPLVVDGSTKSHELFLAYDHFSLSELEPPVVLQEFVNHGIFSQWIHELHHFLCIHLIMLII